MRAVAEDRFMLKVLLLSYIKYRLYDGALKLNGCRSLAMVRVAAAVVAEER